MATKRRALAERREIVGHSQETLARTVGVEPTTVGRWERGETAPQPWTRPKLAEALSISLEDVDHLLAEEQPVEVLSASAEADEPVDDVVLAAPWNHRSTVEAAVMLSGGGDSRVKRRVFLSLTGSALTAPAHQWLVHEPEPLVSGLAGRRVSAGLADRLPAHILGSMAKQAAHQGRPGEAVTLAETALVGARDLESPRLQAELCVRQAYALAANHDFAGCTAAIFKARGHIEQLVADNDPQWLYWVIPAWIIVEAGDSLLLLGQADQAAGMLDEGIGLFDESFVRDRQIYLTHQADALARPGKQRDLDTAADRGIAAIELAESVDSALGVDLLRDLYQQMKPHAKVPAVRDFLECAQGVMTV